MPGVEIVREFDGTRDLVSSAWEVVAAREPQLGTGHVTVLFDDLDGDRTRMTFRQDEPAGEDEAWNERFDTLADLLRESLLD